MKTTWQKIYSWFGFWTYTRAFQDGDTVTEQRVVYWCMFPFYYIRKFDLFHWNTKTYSLKEEHEKWLARTK